MSHPRPWFRSVVSIRRLLVAIGLIAVVLAAATDGQRRQERERRRLGMQMLLGPLMNYHAHVAASYWKMEQDELLLVARRTRRLRDKLDGALWSLRIDGLGFFRQAEIRELIAEARALVAPGPKDQGPTVLERCLTSIWMAHMVAYHDHMRIFYTKQLTLDLAEFPPIPAELEAELRACEAEVRLIRKNPSIDLTSESAPRLRPGASLPKPRPPESGGGDSY